MRRGQSGIEYMVLIGVLLAFLVPILIYATQTTTLSFRTSQSREAVQLIAQAADHVYGTGGRTSVFVTIPSGVTSVSLVNKTVALTLKIDDSQGEAIATTFANLTGSVPTQAGRYKLVIELLANGTVQIGQ